VITLYVMRHAHAASGGGLADRDRPLDETGRDEARIVGGYLRTAGIDYVLVSTALRTRQTVAGLNLTGSLNRAAEPAGSVDRAVVVEPEERFYTEGAETYLEKIRALPDDARTALVCGHNPSVAAVARRLSDPQTSNPQALRLIETYYPTATCCHFEAEGTWGDLTRARLVEVLKPVMTRL
jgi:phosphohistidine phosphatase